MLKDPITFAGSPLDRAGNPRRDAAWLSARRRDPASRFLPLRELKPLIELGPGGKAELAWATPAFAERAGEAPCIFLGLDKGIAHFALDLDRAPQLAEMATGPAHKYIDVRSIAPQVSGGEAAILAQARSLVDWHQRHGFCARCGAPTDLAEAGYSRHCTDAACKAQHFPRTDPVVIMLAVHRDPANGDRILLGRQPQFPPGMFSALAGFMEPGESIEEAVRREIKEEAGIETAAVRYIASQPWPFPSSLMIGCVAEATSDAIQVDKAELDDAQWFSRDELVRMVANATDVSATPRIPPPLSLAHQIAERWLNGA